MAPERQIPISIVVPCYKSEATLPACIDSLLAQDMDEYEIICVNDGSPDRCHDIIRAYEAAHPKLVRGVDQDNGGLWNARWGGVDIARGEYVAFLDSDDTATPDFARSLYEGASSTGADIAVCGFARTDQDTGRVLSTEMCEVRQPFNVADDPGRLIEVNPAAWNKAYRANILRKMRRLRETPAIMEDLALLLLAAPETSGPIVFVPKPLINYMVHADSMINSVTPDQVASSERMLLEVRERYLDQGISDDLRSALDAIAFLHLGVSMSLRISEGNPSLLGTHIRGTTRFLDEYFPTWRRSPYISMRYAREKEGSSFTKLLISQHVYRAHLMRPFLAVYRLVTRLTGSDVKW